MNVSAQLSSSLSSLYAGNSAATVLFDEYANRQRNRRVTNTDWVHQLVKDRGATRADVIAMFRGLEELDCGRYVEGRKGKKSRFEWTKSSLAVCQLATGEKKAVSPADLKVVGTEPEEPDADLERHSFKLRSDLTIEIEVPSDFTVAEADRLARFIQALPRG